MIFAVVQKGEPMTNEQAIEVINGHIKDSSVAYGTSTGQALRMAVEALKAQLSEEGTTKDATSDTISRQAAIDAIAGCTNCRTEEVLREYVAMHNLDNMWSGGVLEAIDAVKDLPSVQPEERTEKRTETRACDLIGEIQFGIKATDADDVYSCGMRNGMRWCMSLIDDKEPKYENCPPRRRSERQGKWIKNDNGTYSCSLCHSWIPEEQHYYAQFCLHCGADMRGEAE